LPTTTGLAPTRRDSAEWLEFRRERLRVYARTAVVVSGVFWVVAVPARTLVPGARTIVEDHSLWWHLVAVLVLAVPWALGERLPRSRVALLALEYAVVVGAATAFALMGFGLDPAPLGHEIMLLAVVTTLVLHDVLVPDGSVGAIVASAVAVLPALVASTLRARAISEAPALVPFFTLGWLGAYVALGVVASRVIYGLEQQVKEAQRLGQYTLEGVIGQGGMGVVHRASHAMLRRATAVKLLPPDRAGDVNLARFEREVQLTASIAHPNVVAIYDYGRTQAGVFYYAMEYVDGLDLQRLVEAVGPLPPARVVHLCAQIASALAEAHAHGLVHRDVKPANVVVAQRGTQHDLVKVLDFGLVRDVAADRTASVTRAGVIAGTPDYLPPEAILHADRVDARSDLYSLGCVAYYLLTGTEPFRAETVFEVCELHLRAEPEAPSARLGRALPEGLEELVLACMAKSPEARPASALDLHGRLLALDVPRWTRTDAVAAWAGVAPKAPRVADPLAAPMEAPSARSLVVDADGRRAAGGGRV
jgi:serine/threonine-protein kinase